jgi:hypothetical protein
VLVGDYNGKAIPTMQFSSDNASYLNPNFSPVSTPEIAEAHALYLKLGGSRPEAGGDGTTVIIPNRSWYHSLSEINADQVRVIATDRG